MTPQDFEFIRTLLKEHSAISLEPGKEYLVENRLEPLARELNLGSIPELVTYLRTRLTSTLQTRIVEAMVTTETSFFRDHRPFEALRKSVLPELLGKRQKEKRLSIWCAAAATGQEPYSVAMLLRENFPEYAGWHLRILATDISQEMLTRCREAKYNQVEVNRGLPAKLLVKYFQQDGNSWQLSEEIRRMVEFQELNLSRPWPIHDSWDLVLLRNVMIYFDVDTKKAILSRIARVLRPDGYLLLGGAETTFHLDDAFRRSEHCNVGFYQLVK